MKAGDLVMLDLGPQHPAQLRRAVPKMAVVVNVDLPWIEVRPTGEQRPPVETYFVPANEVRLHAD
ncbi:hypothetical protein [Cyanobium sp. WKJ7-Wakatipu]|uniref:hypothetical protein n=1 Tax=Cyanobium sp. WKJ7-Wakatipu TaxID=2823726 RepID=UPI0020CCD2F7|nr:hypothetical protein [Cyanobium sp. WKJ7-Wakatipu]